MLMFRRANGYDAGRSSANDRLRADCQIAKSHDPDRAVAGIREAGDAAFRAEADRVMAGMALNAALPDRHRLRNLCIGQIAVTVWIQIHDRQLFFCVASGSFLS